MEKMSEQRVTILPNQGTQEWNGGSMEARGSTDQLSLILGNVSQKEKSLRQGLKDERCWVGGQLRHQEVREDNLGRER